MARRGKSDPARDARIVELYRAGRSFAEVGAEVGRTKIGVHFALRRLGEPVRSKREGLAAKGPEFAAARAERMRRRNADPDAEHIGVCEPVAIARADALGLPRRRHFPRKIVPVHAAGVEPS